MAEAQAPGLHPWRRRRPRRRLVRLTAVAAAIVVLVAACEVEVRGDTLTVVDAQEDAWYSNGDEPYVAVITFRVTPGVPGSTSVSYVGNLQEISGSMYDGDVAAIPPAMATMRFPDVVPRSLAGIAAGNTPEIVGAVTVALESDNSPWSAIDGIMGDVRDELDAQLRAQIEPLTLTDILDPDVAGSRLAEAARRVEAAASPSFWRGVGIWFSSFGDPDDVIGFKVLFLVGVDSQLAPAIDAQLAGLPDGIVGRALKSGPLDVTYAGDGATYRVRWNVAVT